MYCNCSNKNNYEVISLCDIKKFTKKHGPFNNSAWTQISIADVLMLHYTKYYIEKIEKIYVDVSITHTKIIETPISPSINSEGMKLTGKKLLIDGFICSKIVYTSLTKEQTVYTANFTVPFCTYVVIEETADPFNDKYCIKACIEDVFLSLIDCKTVFQNITLFLLAEKKSITCPTPRPPQEDCTIEIIPPIEKFPNVIIIKSKNDKEVAKIELDSANEKFIVTSTGEIPDVSQGPQEYFIIKIKEVTSSQTIIRAHIDANRNGDTLVSELNGKSFTFNNTFIELTYLDPSKIMITNYPALGQMHIPTSTKEIFLIRHMGLSPYTPFP